MSEMCRGGKLSSTFVRLSNSSVAAMGVIDRSVYSSFPLCNIHIAEIDAPYPDSNIRSAPGRRFVNEGRICHTRTITENNNPRGKFSNRAMRFVVLSYSILWYTVKNI